MNGLHGQNIDRFEYFFNTDPGIGNGTVLATTAADSVTINVVLDITGLSAGYHKAGLRSRYDNGMWSHTEFRSLYIVAVAPNTNTAVNRIEYFIDTDPGVGNGTVVNFSANDSVTSNFIVDITSVPAGYHKIGIRTLNTSGRWSQTEFRSLYINPLPDNSNQQIVAGEFYLGDTDPGLGNAAVIDITNPADSITVLRDSVLNNLPYGQHKINVRFKDARGKWSHQETRVLTICNTYGAQSEMIYQVEGNKVFFTNQSLYYDTLTWKFGDNTIDTVTHPIKTYANAGVYNLQLITGNACGIDTLTQVIEIRGLQRITSNSAGNGGIATLTFSGIGFLPSTTISLIRDGIVTNPLQKFYQSPERIIGFFDLNGKPTGLYHAVANIGGAFDTLFNSFTVDTTVKPNVSVSVSNFRIARPSKLPRIINIHNTGNQDAILVPYTSEIGFVEGSSLLDPDYFTYADMVFLNNRGIFQHTFNYLANNGISTDIMLETDTDTLRKKKLLSYMKLKVPANSNTTDWNMVLGQTSTTITLSHGMMVHPPYFKSDIINGNLVSPVKDCINSFLKKAVKKNLTVTINDAAWITCFNEAYDTLAKTIKNIVSDPLLQHQAIPTKAFFSALLARMTDCGTSGLPAVINNNQFRQIIKDMTYNWFFYENIDSLGAPCVDSVIAVSRSAGNKLATAEAGRSTNMANDDCPGAIFAPELAEECEIFTKPCKQLDDLGNLDNFFLLSIGRKIFEKFTEPFDKFCKVNSASVFCEQLCQSTSVDPNIKEGPGNNDDLKYVNHLQAAGFSIRFENLASASAPAAYVEIKDTIDKSVFDMMSFQAGSLGWGDTVVQTEAGRKELSMLIDLRPEHPNKLRIDIKADTASGVVTWKFWTLDTTTLQLTTDPTQGFLPPNVNDEEGVGFASFTIKPKNGVTSGSILQNKASIIFDANAPIITPLWEYRIDTTKPSSHVTVLPPVQNTTQFNVNWEGNDQHSGIRYYSVYVSVNDSMFKSWKSLTTDVSGTYNGDFGNTYKFFSVALDKAGNYEDPPLNPLDNPDAFTMLDAALPLDLLSFIAQKSADQKKADLIWTTANERDVSHFELQRSADGINYATIARIPALNQPAGAAYTWQDATPLPKVNFYRLKMVDKDASYKMSLVRQLRFSDKNDILIFPTVTSDRVFIQSDKELKVELYNVVGTRISVHWVRRNLNLDLSPFASGVYFIRVPSEGKTFKVIKQ